ncbi:MAG: DUF1194 domain-containing protein [Acetobacteraceae bacterium]|nr:DUF1194 domain-containing protein [Acetobacteraceae bacterium]
MIARRTSDRYPDNFGEGQASITTDFADQIKNVVRDGDRRGAARLPDIAQPRPGQGATAGGPGAFALPCPDYPAFSEAMRRKLLREITVKPIA